MKKYHFLFSFIYLIFGCSAAKKASTSPIETIASENSAIIVTTPIPKSIPSDTIPSVFKIDTVYKQSKGSCYGNCPVFEYAILNDGTVLFKGIKNLDKIGNFVAKIDQKKVNELQQNAKAVIGQNFKEYYPEKPHEIIVDFPINTFVFFDKSTIKKIAVNHSGPKILSMIDDKIQNWLASAEWIKID